MLAELLAKHPGITLDLVQTDTVVDLLAERTDVAVRAGPLKNSSLVPSRGRVLPDFLAEPGKVR